MKNLRFRAYCPKRNKLSHVFTFNDVQRGSVFVDTNDAGTGYFYDLRKCEVFIPTPFVDKNRIEIWEGNVVEFPVYLREDVNPRTNLAHKGANPIDEFLDVVIFENGKFGLKKHKKLSKKIFESQQTILSVGLQVVGENYHMLEAVKS